MSHKSPENGVCKGRPFRAHLYRNDVAIDYGAGDVDIDGRGERSEITMLTKASLKRLCFVAHNTAVRFDCMVTLTYPKTFESDGQRVKRHLQRWLQWAQRRGGIGDYLWALEFQRRQAPHFHIFTHGGELLKMKTAVSEKWFKIVDSGDEKHFLAGTRTERLRVPDAAGRYAAKYASKPYQKAVPPDYRNVGRFWGHSRNVAPVELAARPLEGWGDLLDEMQGWDYIERLERRKPIGVLYNATKFLQEKYDNENEM